MRIHVNSLYVYLVFVSVCVCASACTHRQTHAKANNTPNTRSRKRTHSLPNTTLTHLQNREHAG